MRHTILRSSIALFCTTLLFACTPTAPQAPASPSSAAPMHADWTSYKSPEDGYTMELPPMWQINHADIEQHLVLFNNSDDTYRLEMYIAPTVQTLDAYLKKHDADFATAYEGQPGVKVTGSEKVTVGGTNAIKRHEFANAAGFDTFMAYVLHGGKIYEMNFLRMDGKPMSVADTKLFADVLATVKFSN